MQTRRTSGIAAVAAAALCLALAGGLSAQEPPVDFDATGGVGFPVGDLADVADLGPAFSVGFNFGLTERFYLRAQGGAELYDGVDLAEPLGSEGINDLDLNFIHFQAGGLYYLLERDRDDSPAFVTIDGAVGMTNLNVPRVATSVGTDAVELEISELYPSASGGLSIGYAIHEQVDFFVDGRAHVVFGDEDDTAELVQVANDVLDDPVESLGTMWSVPVEAGIRFHF